MPRVLVTGASGFVGRALVPALARVGWGVVAASRSMPLPWPQDVADRIENVHLSDLRGSIDWQALLKGKMDAIIHLAGLAHSGRATDAADCDRINRAATADLAQAAAAVRISHFIFMSSVRAQTGPSVSTKVTERDVPAPSDVYGRSKLAAEDAVRAAIAPHTILRPVLVHGRGVKGNFAALERLAAFRCPLPLLGLHARRSLLALDSLVNVVRFILATPRTRGETFLVADTPPLTLAEIVGVLRQRAGYPQRMLNLSPDIIEAGLRGIGRQDVWRRVGEPLVVDTTKLVSHGWVQTMGMGALVTAPVGISAPERAIMPIDGRRH
jgi:UDP-glucose 4-epimerase